MTGILWRETLLSIHIIIGNCVVHLAYFNVFSVFNELIVAQTLSLEIDFNFDLGQRHALYMILKICND